MLHKFPCGSLCACVNRTEHHPFVRLSIEYDRTIRSGEHERDDREILFAVNNNCHRCMSTAWECPHKVIGDRPRGVLRPYRVPGHRRHTAARGPHRQPINNGNCRGNPSFLQVVGDHVPDRIYQPIGDKGRPSPYPVEFPERILEGLRCSSGSTSISGPSARSVPEV